VEYESAGKTSSSYCMLSFYRADKQCIIAYLLIQTTIFKAHTHLPRKELGSSNGANQGWSPLSQLAPLVTMNILDPSKAFLYRAHWYTEMVHGCILTVTTAKNSVEKRRVSLVNIETAPCPLAHFQITE
jgi:hypothetical protein